MSRKQFKILVSGERKGTKALQAGSSLELLCEAHVPVHWCYPQVYATPDLPQVIILSLFIIIQDYIYLSRGMQKKPNSCCDGWSLRSTAVCR